VSIRVVLILGFAGLLSGAEPFTGTWKLDPTKSSGTIPKDETVIIEKRGRNLSIVVRVVDEVSEGPTFLIRYTVPKKGGVGQIQEGPYDGVALRRIGANAIETTYFSGGKAARSTRAVVSKNGRSMTSTGKSHGPPDPAAWTMVFQKQ
jgi:hypothetical protein